MANHVQSGKFITVEGIDGAGKSLQIQHMHAFLKNQGIQVLITREPGGTPLGEKIRDIVLQHTMSAHCEALLMFASRVHHCEQVIQPALMRGEWVISDRYIDSSYAYQGAARKLGFAKIDTLVDWSLIPVPDLTLILDISVETALKRRNHRDRSDKFEKESIAFHETVRKAFLKRSQLSPWPCMVFNSEEDPIHIQHMITQALQQRFLIQKTSEF